MALLMEPDRHELRLASLLVVLALLLGGGGSPNPMPEVALQVFTALIAGGWLLVGLRVRLTGSQGAVSRVDRRILVAAALILALPLLQITPLPPSVWHNLPGREVQIEVLALVGAEQSWRPLSIAPHLTLAALLALVTPCIAMMLAAQLSSRERHLLIAIVGLGALVSVIPGVLQVSSGGNLGHFYAETHRGVVTGFHANRNAAADLLLIGILASPFLTRLMQARSQSAFFGLALLLMGVAVLLTQSRTGIALLPFAVIGAFLLRRKIAGEAFSWKVLGKWAVAVASGGIAIAAAIALFGPSRMADALRRFTAQSDFRSELWQDGWFAAMQYWPFGSGLGTIKPVLVAVERLENLDQSVPNRVHNDYLELLVETGVLAPIVLLALLTIGLRLLLAAPKKGASAGIVALFAVFTLAALAIHSIMDYPLRSMGLATLAGAVFGMLGPAKAMTKTRTGEVEQANGFE